MKSNRTATLLALLAVLLWSTVATAFKLALSGLHFVQVLAIATFTSFIIFFIVLAFQNNLVSSLKVSINQWYHSALMGFLNPFLYYLVLLKAYSILPAYMALPLNYTWPIVLVLFSAWMLKQRLNLLSLIALLFAFFGVFLISLSKGKDAVTSDWIGVILATGSSIFWSLYWILNIKDNRPVLQKLFLNFLFGSLFMILLLLFLNLPPISLSFSFWAAIYVGFFEMGFTFLIWLIALDKATRTDKISIYIFLSPFISLVFISTILKESISMYAIWGFLSIATGIFIIKWREIVNFERERK